MARNMRHVPLGKGTNNMRTSRSACQFVKESLCNNISVTCGERWGRCWSGVPRKVRRVFLNTVRERETEVEIVNEIDIGNMKRIWTLLLSFAVSGFTQDTHKWVALLILNSVLLPSKSACFMNTFFFFQFWFTTVFDLWSRGPPCWFTHFLCCHGFYQLPW